MVMVRFWVSLASFSSEKMRWPADAIRAWEESSVDYWRVLVDSDGDGAVG